jgi:hypothetical protein
MKVSGRNQQDDEHAFWRKLELSPNLGDGRGQAAAA